MGKNIDNLIDKFVVRKEKELRLLEDLLEMISKYARIYSDGEVEIIRSDITVKDKAFIIILARFLAKRINELKGEEIVKNVSYVTHINEIARIIGKSSKQVGARLSELEKSGFITRTGKGQYTITSLNKALEYLNKFKGEVKETG